MARILHAPASDEQAAPEETPHVEGFDESAAAEYDTWLAMVDARFADEEADAAFDFIAEGFVKLKAL
jgi:hypothetical protein